MRELIDVKTIFLYGQLEEQIHMTQPELFTKKDEEDKICLLKRSHDLKQSLRKWYKSFDTCILNNGFRRCEDDGFVT